MFNNFFKKKVWRDWIQASNVIFQTLNSASLLINDKLREVRDREEKKNGKMTWKNDILRKRYKRKIVNDQEGKRQEKAEHKR